MKRSRSYREGGLNVRASVDMPTPPTVDPPSVDPPSDDLPSMEPPPVPRSDGSEETATTDADSDDASRPGSRASQRLTTATKTAAAATEATDSSNSGRLMKRNTKTRRNMINAVLGLLALVKALIDGDKEALECKQVSKVVLPHVALNCGLLVYLLIGALMFQTIEQPEDAKMMTRKAQKIIDLYRSVERTLLERQPNLDTTRPGWKQQLYDRLYKLSEAHEGRSFRRIRPDEPINATDLYWQRWTFLESTLYALSILTTTGYTYVMPSSQIGQTAAILYGLLGIPIMVLAAVDLGRFLSDCVMWVYENTLSKAFKRYGVCQQKRKKRREGSVRRVISRLHQRSRAAVVRTRLLKNPDLLSARTGTVTAVRHQKEVGRKLPLWVNASILLLFCGFGAIVYMCFEQHITFLEAFFVAFNLLANLTMAEMKSDDNMAGVMYIVCFVTFGLAVLTMCADLAAMELKWLFMKIHYFGRKIRRKRQKISDEDIACLLELIRRIREKYPEKRNSTITKEDIIQFILDEQRAYQELYRAARGRRSTPFDPSKDFRFVDDVQGVEVLLENMPDVDQQSLEYL